jgi:YfiH family protein
MKHPFNTLSPDWEHIPGVHAYTILATSPQQEVVTFAGTGEDALRSKAALLEWTGIPDIHWLNQVHGDTVLQLPSEHNEADAVVTSQPGVICAIRTADCLPVIFTNLSGTTIGVAHAGWKGLHKGILLRTIERFEDAPEHLAAWIGPAIAQSSYEVGPELRETFINTDPATSVFFAPGNADRFFADLPGIARYQLEQAGIPPHQITGGTWDTFPSPTFHSYRRDAIHSGRMLTLAWLNKH